MDTLMANTATNTFCDYLFVLYQIKSYHICVIQKKQKFCLLQISNKIFNDFPQYNLKTQTENAGCCHIHYTINLI